MQSNTTSAWYTLAYVGPTRWCSCSCKSCSKSRCVRPEWANTCTSYHWFSHPYSTWSSTANSCQPGPTPPKLLVPVWARPVLVDPGPPNPVLPNPPERVPVPPTAVFNDPITPVPVLPHLVLDPTPLELGNAGPAEPTPGHGMLVCSDRSHQYLVCLANRRGLAWMG